MSKIYVGQHLKLILESEISLMTATTLEIRYIKPGSSDVVTGLTATPTDTTCYVNLTPTILDTVGGWRFFIYAVIDSKIYFGETFNYELTSIGL